MKLREKDLKQLCQYGITAAIKAGNSIADSNRNKLSVRNKTVGLTDSEKLNTGTSIASQLVTEVDFLSQRIILEELIPTCKPFDLALLTEETPDDFSRFEKDYFWCVDPLDGTLPFVESTSGYAVSISLVSKSGIPFIGIIYDPIEKTLYHAIKGFGVYRNKLPWSLNLVLSKENPPFSIITDRSFLNHKRYQNCIDDLTRFALELGFDKVDVINHGGAVMNACWVLENNPACYFKFPKPETGGGSLWDYAATACVFNEIGALVSDSYGNPIELNRSDSTYMNHKGIIFASNKKIADRLIALYTNL